MMTTQLRYMWGVWRWLRPMTCALVLAICWGVQGANVAAQADTPLQSARDAAIAAFTNGDMAVALIHSEEALRLARVTQGLPVIDLADVLHNVAYLLTVESEALPARAQSLWREALSALETGGQVSTQMGAKILYYLADFNLRTGRTNQGLARLDQTLSAARGTPIHGTAAMVTADLFLKNGAYSRGIVALGELTSTEPELLNNSYANYYDRLNTLIEQAETEERPNDIVTLLEGKQMIQRQYWPKDQVPNAVRGLFFQRYFALHQIGDFQRIQNEITLWLETGTPSEDEQDFIRSQVETATLLADGAHINTLERLNVARSALAFVAGLERPDNHRIGLAYQVVAAAERRFGQFDYADRSLEKAREFLERSDQGRRFLPSVLSDLAWNAYVQGYRAQASAFYASADAARAAAGFVADTPEEARDTIIQAARRTRFLRETDGPAAADAWRAQAVVSGRTGGLSAWDEALLNVQEVLSVLRTQQRAGVDSFPIGPLARAVSQLRAEAPFDSPEFAAELVDAADVLLRAGHDRFGETLLREAKRVNKTALPEVAPGAVRALKRLAQHYIASGERDEALTLLRRVSVARQSPFYRLLLPKVASDFELLAWALVQEPEAASPGDINEAFEALQWTLVTQSASALSYLETRHSVDDPLRSRLVRARQNLVEAKAQTTARLGKARAFYSDASDTGPLSARLGEIEVDLATADSRLNALGLDTGAIGRVVPVSISEVQAMLDPKEVMVTFLLPGLELDQITGAQGSSNHVIAITADSVRVSQIKEPSRARLNDRITAFRCEVAREGPACRRAGSEPVRGAVLEEEDPEDDAPKADLGGFDPGAAQALYGDLFGGIHDVLARHEHVIIVPPADLLRLPFQALVTAPAAGRPLSEMPWMIRQNAISVLPSVASLRALRRGAAQGRRLGTMLGFGDPVIGNKADANCAALGHAGKRAAPPQAAHMAQALRPEQEALADTAFLRSLDRLPDATCELQAIGARFEPGTARLHLRGEARESRVKSLNQSGELALFDVLVFATHGLTGGEAGAASPGLVLTPPEAASIQDDGLLSAAEIAALDLNAELVVMSACNTAAGESGAADGLSGLARAFFRAGARSMLVTHWSVYSQAAVDVSTGLFAELERAPDARMAQALRAATLAILDDDQRPSLDHHPVYWAAFSIIGAT